MVFSCKRDKLSEELEPLGDLFADGGKWYIERYEADGADSTESAFPGNTSNNEPGALTFYSKKAENYPSPFVKNGSFEALFTYYKTSNSLKFANGVSYCDRAANPQCNNNIFMVWCGGSYWDIASMTKAEIILVCKKNNNTNPNQSYRLVLTKTKHEITPSAH